MSGAGIQTPHLPEAEKAILGGICLDAKLLSRTALRQEDFYGARHQKIFGLMLEARSKGQPADLVTLDGLSDEERVYLSDLTNQALLLSGFNEYERLLRETSRKRTIQKILIQAVADLGARDLDGILSDLRGAARVAAEGAGALITSGAVAKEIWELVELRFKDKARHSGIPSGIHDLDTLTDGFAFGDLIILAGRPGTGKSALAAQFAVEAARRGFPVGVISLEMASRQLGIRAISSLSRVEMWRLRKGILSSDDLTAIAEAAEAYTRLPIVFSFSSRDVNAISREISQMVETHSCKLIILDYLQLARGSNRRDNREREISEISWALKSAASMHQVAVMGLAQLNRQSEIQKRKPILSDLRDSGSIEQDADVVLFLHSDDENVVAGRGGKIDLIIGKGRNIGLGEIRLYFESKTMTFKDGTGTRSKEPIPEE